MSTQIHKKNLPEGIQIGVLTVSTSRTASEDKSGQWIQQRMAETGYRVVFYRLVKDIKADIATAVQAALAIPDLCGLIITGGTGIGATDVTIEAVRPLFDKELIAFGALFAQLSFVEIGSAAILSRATAGISKNTALFCIPGSLKACQLACNRLIIPELGHIIKHIQAG